MEKEISFAWYRLRGLGLLCLCSFVFFFGAYLANQRSLAVNGSARTQAVPVDSVRRDDSALALSFDVTDSSGSVGVILDILKQYDARASFFVTSGWVEAYPEEIRRMAEEGHDIGSRGTDRESMTGEPKIQVKKILEETRDKVEALTGIRMNLFRAPYGEYDSVLTQTAVQEGYLPVRWSVDSEDWKDYGIESITKNVTQNRMLGAGAIVRMHGGARHTAQALETIVYDLQQQGYVLTPISKLLK